MTEQEIRDLFKKLDVPLDRDDVWSVQAARVVKHKALERLAAALNITYDAPQVLRAERDEAVILVTGHIGDRSEWSIGEALATDGSRPGNYKVTGKQAPYVYAMAEKRAKDRVILKLAGLHGAYSEDEADDFKSAAPQPAQQRDDAFNLPPVDEPTEDQHKTYAMLREVIAEGNYSANELLAWAGQDDTKAAIATLTTQQQANLRTLLSNRLQALGYKSKRAA